MEKATAELVVCRAEYRAGLTRIRRFILKIVGVKKRGVEIVRLKIFFVLDRLTMIE